MNFEIYLKLVALSSLSIVVSVFFYLLKRLTPFGKLNPVVREIIIGIGFGIVAIMGTQYGVNVGGNATANARDAAPLCAALLFSGPAGIIAGTIGGIWRWIVAVAWGAGVYSKVACSVSTFLAGVIGAILRRFMFDNRRPGWVFSFAIAAVVEVLHMTILFLTHFDDPGTAFEVVKVCTNPMVFCNGFSVMFSTVIISICSTGIHRREKRYRNITQLIQTPLLIAVVLAFCISSLFIYSVQTGYTKNEINEMMEVNLDSMKVDILKESDSNILTVAHNVAKDIDSSESANLNALAEDYGITEINIVDKDGIITDSTDSGNIGFDMNSDSEDGTNSKTSEFMKLAAGECDELVQESRANALDDSETMKYAGVSLDNGGFVEIGYNVEEFHSDIIDQIKILADNRHIGESGYVVVTDENMNIVTSDNEYDGTSVSDYGLDVSGLSDNEMHEVTIKETDVYVMMTESEGFNIIGIITTDDAYATRDNMLYIYSYLDILIFAVLFVIIYLIIKKIIVNNIRSVNNSLGKIIGGNLDTTVDVHSSEEFASLSDDINSTVDTLKKYIKEAASRIDKELAFAKNIQHSALPSVFPAYPNRRDFDVYATMDTAKEVGGDFYDFYFVDENKFAILIADVSGKGIPAAMFMMTAKTAIKGFAESQIPVNEVFTKANEQLCDGNDADMFVTAWMGIIDLKTGHVTYANAGHNPPVIYRKGRGPEYLKSRPGLVLAGMSGLKYRIQEFDLKPGDRIFLYTDGVTEATRSDNVLYGEDRLIRFIKDNETLSAEDMLKSVKADIDGYVGDAEQFDDITMLMFDYNGSETVFDEIVLPAKTEKLDEAMNFINEKIEDAGVPMKTSMKISVAFEEMFVNVAHYAYPESEGDVTVGVSVDDKEVSVRLVDSGIPFNPLEKADPDTTLSAEERQIGGLGIFMVKKTMDDVSYEYTDGKNIFTMRKKYE